MATKDELLALSGWQLQVIEDLAHQKPVEGSSLAGLVPNNAFFSLLIETIEESADLSFKDSLPSVIKRLGLTIPRNISSFIRSVRRCAARSVQLSIIPRGLNIENIDTSPLCTQAGITIPWLLECADNLKPSTSLTYSMLWELSTIRDRQKRTFFELAKWIQRILNSTAPPSGNSVKRKLKFISKERYRLRFSRDKVSEFMSTEYKMPAVSADSASATASVPLEQAFVDNRNVSTENVVTFPTLAMLAANALGIHADRVLQDNLSRLQSLTNSVEQASNELANSEKEKQSLEEHHTCQRKVLLELQTDIELNHVKLNELKQKVGTYGYHNVYRRDKRANEARQKLKGAEKDISELKDTVAQLRRELSTALKLKSKQTVKLNNLEKGNCSKCEQNKAVIESLKARQIALEFENVSLLDEVAELKNQDLETCDLNNNLKKNVIHTKVGKTYRAEIRAISMQLISLGVAVGKVSEVVRSVIEGLTGMKIGRLPSKGTMSQLQTR
ncbi:uncharacterized protein LOC135489002 [Lineus longissimus]|uniref:uncharacterized protein LOC135489002 n=1 Tax=Lineus longissimus TaxID=88925 RepID=UPI00315D21AA